MLYDNLLNNTFTPGIFRKGVVNILGNGVALDPENLWNEMQEVEKQGVALTPENLKISDRASLLMPWHRALDGLEEARLADKKFGSTKQGIAPFYADKYSKKTVLAGELLHPEHLREHLKSRKPRLPRRGAVFRCIRLYRPRRGRTG